MASHVEHDSDEKMSGWLHKRPPSGLVRTWKKRWFVITLEQLDAEAKYYTTSACDDLKGCINLMELLEIRVDAADPLKFDLVMKDRVFELQAPTTELREQWTSVVSTVSSIPVSGNGGGADRGVRYAHEGYLLKESGGNSTAKKFDRRYFRLRDDETARHLQYFKDEKSVAALGTIALEDITEVKLTVTRRVTATSHFEVKTRARTYFLGQPRDCTAGKGEWIAKLRTAAGCEPPPEDKDELLYSVYEAEDGFRGTYDEVLAHERALGLGDDASPNEDTEGGGALPGAAAP
jgi:hypothetical protein